MHAQTLQSEELRMSSLEENVGISLLPETLYTSLTATATHLLF